MGFYQHLSGRRSLLDDPTVRVGPKMSISGEFISCFFFLTTDLPLVIISRGQASALVFSGRSVTHINQPISLLFVCLGINGNGRRRANETTIDTTNEMIKHLAEFGTTVQFSMYDVEMIL